MTYEKYRYVVFGALGMAYILVFFHRLAPAIVAVDMMTDLKTGGALMGVLASAYFYPYAMMQIPAGLLSDSWGPRRSIVFFSIFSAAGAVILGLAHNISAAIIGRILVGLGVAMVFIPTLKIMTNWFEPHRFVRMSGLLMSMGGFGAYTASTPLAMLSGAMSWRGSMMVIGILTLVVSLLVWILVRDTPEESGYPPVDGYLTAVNYSETKIGLLSGIFMVIRNKQFWPTAMCSFFGSLVLLSFNGLWGGPFLMHVYDLSRSQTGGVLSMMAVGLIVGAPVMSWFSNRVFRSRKKVLMLSHFFAVCIFVPLAFFPGDFPEPALYLWCFFFNFFLSSLVVVGYSAIKDSFPIKISGTATGVLNIFPFAGVALGQPLIGWYLDSFGSIEGKYPVEAYALAFKVCLVSLLLAFVATTLVKEVSTQTAFPPAVKPSA